MSRISRPGVDAAGSLGSLGSAVERRGERRGVRGGLAPDSPPSPLSLPWPLILGHHAVRGGRGVRGAVGSVGGGSLGPQVPTLGRPESAPPRALVVAQVVRSQPLGTQERL